jgi:hypothetical protein
MRRVKSYTLTFAKGTLRSRFITVSVSVICAMVATIDPGIDAQAR